MKSVNPARSFTAAALGLLALAGSARAAPPAGPDPIAQAFPLIFDSEVIRLAIAGDTLEVRGTYVLRCRVKIEDPIALFYPFPRDSLMGDAKMISLLAITGGEAPVPARWEDVSKAAGVRWWIPPCRGDSVVLESVYRQRINAPYARYIVTTTQVWGRPLRHAAFEIRLPPGATPLEFSFPFERRAAGADSCYAYDARDFLPDRDIEVRWRRNSPSTGARR